MQYTYFDADTEEIIAVEEFIVHKQAMDFGVKLMADNGINIIATREGGPWWEHFFFMPPSYRPTNYVPRGALKHN